ncbi:MAG: asparagine synthetase B family protein [Kiloniellales bacterium]
MDVFNLALEISPVRVAGIYAPAAGVASRFIELTRDGLDAATQRHARILAFPETDPVVAAIIRESACPRVQWASIGDGSFAIVDGEVFVRPEGVQTDFGLGDNDASALLQAYLRDGEAAVAQFDAAASMAIWDAGRKRFLVFRDRFGIVPVYYTERLGGILWADDVATLLRAGVAARVNLPALDFFLADGFVPAPWSFVEQIKKIPPAHVLSCESDGTSTLRRYWRPKGRPKVELSVEETTAQLRQSFQAALRRRYSPNLANGVLLSGGVDSKLIVAGLRRLLDVACETFTFRYTDYEGKLNELEPARRVAEHFATRHHEIEYRPSDVVDNLDWMVRSYGEPFTWGLHSWLLRDVVDAGVAVLFNGAGPDGWYLSDTNVQGLRFARLPAPLKLLGRVATPLLRGRMGELLESVIWCGQTGLPARCSSMITPDEMRTNLYRNARSMAEFRRAKHRLLERAAEAYAEESERDRICFLHRQFVNAEGTLHWNHWWARAHALSIRFPYFDNDLLDFAMRLPRQSRNKEEIRRLAATLMPREMAYSPKIAQAPPIGHWLRGPLRDFLRDQLAPARLHRQGLFDPAAVHRLVQAHLGGKPGRGMTLWAIITVTAWMDLASRRQLWVATPEESATAA